MFVKQFKFKRNTDNGGQWTAESEIERPGFYRGFTAVGKTLATCGRETPSFGRSVSLTVVVSCETTRSRLHPNASPTSAVQRQKVG